MDSQCKTLGPVLIRCGQLQYSICPALHLDLHLCFVPCCCQIHLNTGRQSRARHVVACRKLDSQKKRKRKTGRNARARGTGRQRRKETRKGKRRHARVLRTHPKNQKPTTQGDKAVSLKRGWADKGGQSHENASGPPCGLGTRKRKEKKLELLVAPPTGPISLKRSTLSPLVTCVSSFRYLGSCLFGCVFLFLSRWPLIFS